MSDCSYDRRNECNAYPYSVCDQLRRGHPCRAPPQPRPHRRSGLDCRDSKQFTQDVEHGKPTVQFGRVLKLLAELGIPLEMDIPDEAARALAISHTETNAKPLGRRQSAESKVPPGQKKRI